MSGSGPQDRDESLAPISSLRPFALIAHELSSSGTAVLRYDDRGVGQSSGAYAAATIEQLAADGGAALDFLRAHAAVDPARVGLLGHSEGGLYAAMLAADRPEVAFVIGLAAPAVDGVTLIVDQQEAITRAAGASREEIEMAAAFASKAMPLARDGNVEALETELRGSIAATWDGATSAERELLGEKEAYVESQVAAQLSTMTSDWYRSFLAYDPGPDWRRVAAPVLAIYGGRDVQVLPKRNATALRAALERAGNDDVSIITIPEANHLFQAAETGALQEYGRLEPEFAPDVLPTIVAWLTERDLGEGPLA
jgi:pimeloyl-ACP methyl ester carboxylesterase